MTLSEFLHANKMTAAEFARAAEVTRTTASRWAAGKLRPKLAAMARIQRITGGQVTVAEMVAEYDGCGRDAVSGRGRDAA